MQKESGLSEVIGFILIIAILVVLASLYVTYVVPAHGREAEIAHMTYVKDQFVDFKMAMDSLWINSLVNTSLSQNLEMGTLGQSTEGQFTFLPLAQPIGSSGKMNVSTDASGGTIRVELTGFVNKITDTSGGGSASGSGTQIVVNPDVYKQMVTYQSLYPVQTNNMIRVPVPVDSVLANQIPLLPNDFSVNQSVVYHLLDIYPKSTNSASYQTTANWTASFDLVRVPSLSVPSGNATAFSSSKSPYQMKADYRYDIVMSLVKRNMSTLQNYPVFQNFTLNSSSQRPVDFWINLQDPAYGLDASGPMVVRDSSGNRYSGSLNITSNWDFNESMPISVSTPFNITKVENSLKSNYNISIIDTGPTNMGKFSYTGENFYWVPQEYYYQLGGVFLNQSGSVSKVAPLITLGMKDSSAGPIPSISITKFIISQQNMTVAGSSSVQVSSSVYKIWRGVIMNATGQAYNIAPVSANAQNIKITIGPDSLSSQTRQMWSDTFNSTIRSANRTFGFYTNGWASVKNETQGVVFRMGWSTDTPGFPKNISVDYSEVNVSIILQPVGWQGS